MNRLRINASLANTSITIFNRDRKKEYLYLYSYFVDYINFHAETDLIDFDNKSEGLENLIQIFSAAAFIKWKLLSDFSTDAMKIAKDLIIPINNIVEKVGISSFYCGEKKKINKMLYFPQLHPLGTAASSKSAKGIIETFAKNKIENSTDYLLFTFACNPLIDTNFHETQFYSDSLKRSLILYEYKGIDCIPEVIAQINPDGIIYDYFTYPWTFIPYAYPNIKFVYMSFGFTPLIFNHTRSIICYNIDEKTKNFISEHSFIHASGLKEFNGRAELRILNSSTKYDNSIHNDIQILRNKYKYIVVTLCRFTKITKNYLETIYSLLSADPNICFIAAGPGVSSIQFDQNFLGRIMLFNEIQSEILLEFANIYIETYPEHQGRAAVEAIEKNIPVIFLNNDKFTHVNLHERSMFGSCITENEIVNLSLAVLHDQKLREDFISDQSKISSNFLCKPDKVWQTIIEAFDY